MGYYGISSYGVGAYGDASFTQFVSNLAAEPRAYDKIFLTWDIPNGSWTRMALVRSSFGFPSWIGEGTLLFTDELADARTSYMDGDPFPVSPGPLRSGEFYYYTLFIYLDADEIWEAAGTAFALTTEDYGSGAMMYDRLPSHYREDDAVIDSPLQSFLSLFGYQQDRIRTEVTTLLDVFDLDRTSGGLLPVLADMLGREYEPVLGMIRSRAILKNSVYMTKMKGTRLGIEAAASSYSGWGATASVGINLLLDFNDSDFRQGIGHWTVANGAIEQWPESSLTPAITATDSLRITGNGSTPTVLTLGTWAGHTLIPVEGGEDHTLSVYVQTAVTPRNWTLIIEWFSQSGTSISTSTSGATADAAGSWTRIEFTAAAPADAVWAQVRLSVAAVANAEVHYLGAVMLEQASSASDWESARLIYVNLDPWRINEAANPSVETNTNGWAAGADTAIASSTAEAYSGADSLRVTRTGSTGTAAFEYGDVGYEGLAEGDIVTFSVYVLSTVSRTVSISVEWLDGSAAVVDTEVITSGASDTDWTRYSGTLIVPATVVGYNLLFTVAAVDVGEYHYFDALLVEKTSSVRDYFDASTVPSGEGLWEDNATHAGRSFFYPQRPWRNNRLTAVLPEFLPPGQAAELIYAPA